METAVQLQDRAGVGRRPLAHDKLVAVIGRDDEVLVITYRRSDLDDRGAPLQPVQPTREPVEQAARVSLQFVFGNWWGGPATVGCRGTGLHLSECAQAILGAGLGVRDGRFAVVEL